jgi:hypothetical protein
MIEQEYVRERILIHWLSKMGGLRAFPLERKIVKILLIRQESFGLVKEVFRHFVIISAERGFYYVLEIDDNCRL